MRELDITKQDIRCCDDFYVEKGYVNIPYELWFEVDKYFGTNTKETNSWINFYTFWRPDGSITATYEIDYPDATETHDWELTKDEEEFFRDKMEEYCKYMCECTLEGLYKEYK